MSMVALSIDGGELFDRRRNVQAAADAAALAAANDLFNNYQSNNGLDPSGTGKASALSTAAANGYSNDGVASVVTVNIPPQSGNFSGKPAYCEVIVQYNQTRRFSEVFGSGNLPVQSRAVACGNPGSVGILVLDPSMNDSLEIDGNLNIVNNGQITVDSNSSSACVVAGTATLNCGGLNVVGNISNGGNVVYTNGGSLHTGVASVADPLANIPEPVPTGTNYGSVTCSGTQTLYPGIYDAITVSKNATVTMMPGVYYLGGSGSGPGPGPKGGGLTVQTGATLSGTGVMFYNQSGDNIDFRQAAGVDLTPPSSGPYRGISLWQPRNDPREIHIESSSNVTMSGTFYAQTGEFDFRPDGAGTVFNMGNYICDQMEAGQGYNNSKNKSNGQINLNPGSSAPTQRCILVE